MVDCTALDGTQIGNDHAGEVDVIVRQGSRQHSPFAQNLDYGKDRYSDDVRQLAQYINS